MFQHHGMALPGHGRLNNSKETELCKRGGGGGGILDYTQHIPQFERNA
jgi:hypothetical protein